MHVYMYAKCAMKTAISTHTYIPTRMPVDTPLCEYIQLYVWIHKLIYFHINISTQTFADINVLLYLGLMASKMAKLETKSLGLSERKIQIALKMVRKEATGTYDFLITGG